MIFFNFVKVIFKTEVYPANYRVFNKPLEFLYFV